MILSFSIWACMVLSTHPIPFTIPVFLLPTFLLRQEEIHISDFLLTVLIPWRVCPNSAGLSYFAAAREEA